MKSTSRCTTLLAVQYYAIYVVFKNPCVVSTRQLLDQQMDKKDNWKVQLMLALPSCIESIIINLLAEEILDISYMHAFSQQELFQLSSPVLYHSTVSNLNNKKKRKFIHKTAYFSSHFHLRDI